MFLINERVSLTWRKRLPGKIPDWLIKVFIYYAAAKISIFIFGFISYEVLVNIKITGWKSWLLIWNHWDATHYYQAMQIGYEAAAKTDPTIIKFLPMFPWLSVILSPLFRGEVLLSAFVVNGIASFAAGILFYHLTALDHEAETAERAVFFFYIFPTSYFLHILFSEAVFIAFITGSFLAARKKQWILAGILGGVAGLSRINAVILVPALFAEAWQQFSEDKKWKSRLCGVGIVLMGLLGYLWFNQALNGDPFSFLKHQMEGFSRSLAFPWVGIINSIKTLSWRPPVESHMVVYQELLFVALGVVATVYGFMKRFRPSYLVWMIGNQLFYLSNTFILSIPRYTLILFPIFIVFAHWTKDRRCYSMLCLWSLLSMALFISQFIRGKWAF